MIGDILNYMIIALNKEFDDPNIEVDPEVVPGNIAFIDAYQETAANTTNNKLIVSVVNISQESSLRNLPYRTKSTIVNNPQEKGQNNSPGTKCADNGPECQVIVERSPEIWMNVFILFGANKSAYIDSLNYISRVIGFFQKHHVFTPSMLNDMVGGAVTVKLPGVEKLIFDLSSLSFEELNQLWGILGGKYIPSVLYKMRMAVIQEAVAATSTPIQEIGAEPAKV